MEGMATLETPVETIWRMIMSPHQASSLMTVIQMGIVPSIVENKKPVTAGELAKKSGAEKLLIVRMMRPLTALGIFKETDEETYTSAPISQTLMAPALMGGFTYMFKAAPLALSKMPDYLEKTGFKNVSGSPGPFEDAHNFPDGFFPWLINTPGMLSNFNNFMSGQRQNRKDWYDFFPEAVEEILHPKGNTEPTNGTTNGTTRDPTLFIDIAGGEGHDIEAFHKRHPHAPGGRLVLQETPETIDNIKPGKLSDVVTLMKYDFFTPQPIKGARVYYFRSIFHDWPDKACVSIMKNTAAAMKKGHSKLLIFEFVLPEKNTPLYPALLDINMMALLNGMERNRAQWTALLDAAGLEVVKFWTAGDDTEALIEAQLK